MLSTTRFIILVLLSGMIGLLPAPATASAKLAFDKNCMACHKAVGRMIGPGFDQIAQKYAGQPDIETFLATKIIEGGKGSFGQVPMPRSPGVSLSEATQLAHWILTGEEGTRGATSPSAPKAVPSPNEGSNVAALLQEAIIARNELRNPNARQQAPSSTASQQLPTTRSASPSGPADAGSVVMACLQHREAPRKQSPDYYYNVGEIFTNGCNEPIRARWCNAKTRDTCDDAGHYGYDLQPGASKTFYRNSEKTVGFIFWACKLSEGGRKIRMDFEGRCLFE